MLILKVLRRLSGAFSIFMYRVLYFRKLQISGKVTARRGLKINIDGHGVLTVGDRVFFNNDVSINCRDEIFIGEGTIFGENVKIYDHDHAFDENGVNPQVFHEAPIYIGNHVWIGSNVTILKGVTIGDYSVVSAGTTVTKNVGSHTLLIQKKLNSYFKIKDSK